MSYSISVSPSFPLSLFLSFSVSKDITSSSSFFFFSPLEMAIFQMFNRFVKVIPPGGIPPIGVRRGQYTSREQDHKLSLASPRCASLGRARSHNFLLLPSSTASAPAPARRHSIFKKAPLTRGSFSHSRGGAGWNPGVKLWKNWGCHCRQLCTGLRCEIAIFPCPPRTGLSHVGRKRLYLSPVRICQN